MAVEQELEGKTAEELRAMAAAAETATTTSTEPSDELLRYETTTGQVFEGKTHEEIIEKMQKSIESGSTTIRQQKDELERGRAVETKEVKPPADFTTDQYYQQWAKDPNDANLRLLAKGAGYDDPQQFIGALKALPDALGTLQEIRQAQALFQFHAIVGEGYPGGDETADKIIAKLAEWGVESERATGRQMADAYTILLAEGKVKPLEVKPGAERQDGRRAPASVTARSTRTAESAVDEDKIMTMPREELDKLMLKEGLKKW